MSTTNEPIDPVTREFWLQEALQYADEAGPDTLPELTTSFLRILAEEVRRLRTPLREIDDLPLADLNETERTHLQVRFMRNFYLLVLEFPPQAAGGAAIFNMERTLLSAFHSTCTVMDVWNAARTLDPED